MEKEESVGQGGKKKKRHAWSDKIKRLGEEEEQGRWETGAVEPGDGPSREAEPAAGAIGRSCSAEAAGEREG